VETKSQTRTLYDSVEEAIADVAQGAVYRRGRRVVLTNEGLVWYLAGKDGERRWEPMSLVEEN
jgi:hypothetical protein